MRMKFYLDSVDGAARCGRVVFGRGTVDTPAFMPVGTGGAVRSVSPLSLIHI